MKPPKAAVVWPEGKDSNESSISLFSPVHTLRLYIMLPRPLPACAPTIATSGLQTAKQNVSERVIGLKNCGRRT